MGREIATMMLQRPECKAIANTAVALKLSLVFGLLLVPQIASQSSSHPTAALSTPTVITSTISISSIASPAAILSASPEASVTANTYTSSASSTVLPSRTSAATYRSSLSLNANTSQAYLTSSSTYAMLSIPAIKEGFTRGFRRGGSRGRGRSSGRGTYGGRPLLSCEECFGYGHPNSTADPRCRFGCRGRGGGTASGSRRERGTLITIRSDRNISSVGNMISLPFLKPLMKDNSSSVLHIPKTKKSNSTPSNGLVSLGNKVLIDATELYPKRGKQKYGNESGQKLASNIKASVYQYLIIVATMFTCFVIVMVLVKRKYSEPTFKDMRLHRFTERTV